MVEMIRLIMGSPVYIVKLYPKYRFDKGYAKVLYQTANNER